MMMHVSPCHAKGSPKLKRCVSVSTVPGLGETSAARCYLCREMASRRASRLLVVLSPAKALDFSAPARDCLDSSAPRLLRGAEEIVATALVGKSAAQLGKTLGISAALSSLNHRRYQAFRYGARAPHDPGDNAAQAITAYNGRAWKGLDQATLDDSAMTYCGSTLRILSGLYGLLRPGDVIQPYRLDFGTKITVGEHTGLYSFWGDRVRDALLADKPDVVVNAASGEYWKGVGEAKLRESGVRVVTVSFREGIGKGARVIAVHAKWARGMYVRWMCETKSASVESLKAFSEANYAFDDKLSSEDEFVFTRASAPPKKVKVKAKAQKKAAAVSAAKTKKRPAAAAGSSGARKKKKKK